MWTSDSTSATGCVWPVIDMCDTAQYSDATVANSELMAIELLWIATGRQYGECPVTVRPCNRDDLARCDTAYAQWPPYPMPQFGTIGPDSYLLLHCSSCGTTSCECATYPTVTLPHRNVTSVTNVTIDGVTLDPADYRLNGRRLLRLDDTAWPTCQDWGVDNGQVGSWSVTYRHGSPVPVGGQIAAGVLTCELVKACEGSDDCLLPRRIQEVTRQGVTAVFTDPNQYAIDGLFGIFEIDSWIQSVNPNRMARKPRLIRADQPRGGSRIVRS